ncbi:HNH endonuclease [Gemmata sp.]|uniref:HNH endonuclease n=1 Tax=Gemmata sp. TaxID=1914242 RepID=UPI003F700064
MPSALQSTIKASELMKLLERQDFRCAYTGRSLSPETASVDHITPISRGGLNELSNLAIVHMDVNTAKSSMTLEEFVAVCREVVDNFERHMSSNRIKE